MFESTLLDVFCGAFVVIFVPASNLAWVVVASVRAKLALARRQATRYSFMILTTVTYVAL